MAAIEPVDMRFVGPRLQPTAAPHAAAVCCRGDLTMRGYSSYACHEGNYGLHHMLSTSRLYDR